MYINYKYLKRSKLTVNDCFILFAAKQLEVEYIIENLTDGQYSHFKELSLVEHIKQKSKKEHPYNSLRLSSKGKQFIEDLTSAPNEEEDIKVFDWLSKYYLNAGKEIGNRRKTLNHIKDFRIKSDISKNNLINLCIHFLKENEDRSNKLEFVFYYPKTVFATRFDLEESWLYSHYLKNEDYFKSIFETY